MTAKSGLRAAGKATLGVAAADYDNDGYTDLFVAFIGGNRLYRNGGDGVRGCDEGSASTSIHLTC
ncbi:MAG: VCBS repeat-containing protein [Bryobacteraceae bacterium]